MKICQEHIEAFERHLFQNETAKSTIGVYRTIVADFVKFLDGRDLEKDLVLEYKSVIMDRNMSSTVNSKIGPLNLFLRRTMARPLLAASTVMYASSPTRMPVAQSICRARAMRWLPMASAVLTSRTYSS